MVAVQRRDIASDRRLQRCCGRLVGCSRDNLYLVRVQTRACDCFRGSFKRGRDVIFCQNMVGYVRGRKLILQSGYRHRLLHTALEDLA